MLLQILLGVCLPAIVAGAVLWITGQLWRRSRPCPNVRWGAALAPALGYVAAYSALFSWPPFPPQRSEHWLFYVTLLAAGLGAWEATCQTRALTRIFHTEAACLANLLIWKGFLKTRNIDMDIPRFSSASPNQDITRSRRPQCEISGLIRWAARAVVAGIALCLQIQGKFRGDWAGTAGVWWFLLLLALTMVLWWSLENLGSSRGWVEVTLMAFGTLTSLNLLFTGSLALCQMTGMLTASLGAVWVLTTLWAPALDWQRGALPVMAILFSGLLLNGYLYSDLPTTNAFLLLSGLAGGALTWRLLRGRMSLLATNVLRTAVVLALAGLALYLAMRSVTLSQYED